MNVIYINTNAHLKNNWLNKSLLVQLVSQYLKEILLLRKITI